MLQQQQLTVYNININNNNSKCYKTQSYEIITTTSIILRINVIKYIHMLQQQQLTVYNININNTNC